MMEAQPETTWKDLVGHRVQMAKDGNLGRTGYVDDVTHGADGLWLKGDGVETRTLYLKAEGFSARTIRESAGKGRRRREAPKINLAIIDHAPWP